jgi:glycine/D-amino acid oxidase-like deaminating enzyme
LRVGCRIFWQEADGRLLAPAAAFHQTDTGENLSDPLGQAQAAVERIGTLLGLSVTVESVLQAERPVPGDGLPAVGRVPGVPGLWLAVLHSGVTLSAIVAATLGAEIAGQGESPLLAEFRPSRVIF